MTLLEQVKKLIYDDVSAPPEFYEAAFENSDGTPVNPAVFAEYLLAKILALDDAVKLLAKALDALGTDQSGRRPPV